MSVLSYPTPQPGGIILDLNDTFGDDPQSVNLLTLEEATSLSNQLRKAVIEATLAIDPTSRIREHLARTFEGVTA